MEKTTTIFVAKDFSRSPYGRDADDGDNNGERFRHQYLLPALSKAEKVIVEMDGVDNSYGSSFLEEAFGGLIRYGYFRADELRNRIEVRSSFRNDIDRIELYYKRADYASQQTEREEVERRNRK